VQYHPVAPDQTILTLTAGDVVVTVYPSFGARIGQITVAGQPLLVDVPAGGHDMTWGSFPMAPWAGRIRKGRFTYAEVGYQLAINHRDGDGADRAHAIHGLVFDRPWPDVHDVSATSWTSTRDLTWPFGGSVTQTIDLAKARLVTTLTVESSGDRFPAEVGWHPWFRKPERLEFSPTAMYERDEFGLPTGRLVKPSKGPWDDCFTNTTPIGLQYDRPTAPTVTVTSDCDHWVVYDHPSDATCVEPQSGPPDAFNLAPHTVEPGNPLRRTMTIDW